MGDQSSPRPAGPRGRAAWGVTASALALAVGIGVLAPASVAAAADDSGLWAVHIAPGTAASTTRRPAAASRGASKAPAPAASLAGRDGSASLVVSPHPDDELSLAGLYQFTPEAKVFVFVANGAGSGAGCVLKRGRTGLVPVGYDEARGEWLPEAARNPDSATYGRKSAACTAARQESTVRAIRALREVDPYLPDVPLRPTRRVTLPGVGPAVVHDGGRSGAVVFLDVHDGEVTAQKTADAIHAVTRLRPGLGLAPFRWKNLIGSAYYSAQGSERCHSYPHSDHRAVHDALKEGTFAQFSGFRAAGGCPTDEGITHSVDLDPRYVRAALGPGGALDRYYSWLTGGPWNVDTGRDSTRSVFSTHQAYWTLPARADRVGGS